LVGAYKELLSTGKIIRRDDCHEINDKGEDKYLRILAVPLKDEKGKILGAISLASDNTNAVKFKNELLELNASLEERVKQRTIELNKTNKELSRVLELKSTFMADISHEFRTSFTIMQCSLELLINSCACRMKKEKGELFDNVITEIKRASNMLYDLNLINQSDSQELKINHEKININASVTLICKELEVLARERNVKIEYDQNPPEILITADKESIEKMLLNLVRNAVKYNKKSGGWIRVWTETNKNGVRIKIEDNGIGIDKKDIPYIFERFYRVDKARTRNGEDSGLGLAIAKHVAEIHNGNINVKSKLGKGTTFSVYLPYNSKN